MVTVRVEVGAGDQAALVLSLGFPSDPETALAKVRDLVLRTQLALAQLVV